MISLNPACLRLLLQIRFPKARAVLPLMGALVLFAIAPGCTDSNPNGGFRLLEASIAQVHAAMIKHEISCEQLVGLYLERIQKLDAKLVEGNPLHAIRLLDPTAIDQAKALDQLFAVGGFVGSLHCVPVLLKDNYDTAQFPTTGGSMALQGSQPAADAFTVKQLRAAGAVILAKTNMAELAFYPHSINSWTGSVGSAYDPAKDAGGSSSGSAAGLAANFALAATGTDTCGSNRAPAANNALVGIRVSQGLVSQKGLLPTSSTRDAPGPMARSVRDLALMLDVMAGIDNADPNTLDPQRVQPRTYTASLREDGMKGKRIGVLRQYGTKLAALS